MTASFEWTYLVAFRSPPELLASSCTYLCPSTSFLRDHLRVSDYTTIKNEKS